MSQIKITIVIIAILIEGIIVGNQIAELQKDLQAQNQSAKNFTEVNNKYIEAIQ